MNMKKPLYRPSMIALFLLGIFTLGGCLKNDNNPSVNIDAAGVAFIHASPKNDLLEFVDYDTYGTILARLPYNTSSAYPTNENTTTPYRAFYPGARTFGVARAGTNFFYHIKQFALKPNNVYSVFAVDSANKAELLLVHDSLRVIDSTKVAIKFINLSPDAGNIDFLVSTNPEPLATDVAFKSSTAYKVIAPSANATLNIRLKSGDKTGKSRTNVELKQAGSYTVWARGLVNGTQADTLAISVLKTR